MKIIHSLTSPLPYSPTVATIGNFDGMHIGHQKLIASVVQSAHAAGRKSALITFTPHTRTIINQRDKILTLTPDAQKLEFMKWLGLDLVILIHFSQEIMKQKAGEFISQLITKFKLEELWIGHDFHFGYQREGNYLYLAALGKELGFSVHEIPPVIWDGKPVSSSRIRNALRSGDLEDAHKCLGWQNIVRGHQGRALTFEAICEDIQYSNI